MANNSLSISDRIKDTISSMMGTSKLGEDAAQENLSSPKEILGAMYNLMMVIEDERKREYKFKEISEKQKRKAEDTYHKQLIKALTPRKAPKKIEKAPEVKPGKPETKGAPPPAATKPTTAPPAAPPKAPPAAPPKTTPPSTPPVTQPKPATGTSGPRIQTEPAKVAKIKKSYPKEQPPKTTTPVSPAAKSGGISTSTKISAVVVAGISTNAAASVRRIVEVGSGYNIVETPEGSIIKQEGAWNWRNNNPGNIEYGDYALKMGAIPFKEGQNKPSKPEERFAVFPTYEIGRRAKAGLIFEGKNYKDLNVDAAIARYAPPFDKNGKKENDTVAYQNTIKDALMNTGLSVSEINNKKMSEYNQSQQSAILNAMEKMEGYGSGKKQSTIVQSPPQTPQNAMTNQSGTQVNQASTQNKDMKNSLQKDAYNQSQTANINVSSPGSTQAPPNSKVDDRSPYTKAKG
jgi:nitrate reductase cytochrome c-type subunit